MARLALKRLVALLLLAFALLLFCYYCIQHQQETIQDGRIEKADILVKYRDHTHLHNSGMENLSVTNDLLTVPVQETNSNSQKQDSSFKQPLGSNHEEPSSTHPEPGMTPTAMLKSQTSNSTAKLSLCASMVAACNGWLNYNDPSSCNGTGFALSLAFWDQQTWACGNLFGLQHWASTLEMVVVEPFLINTKLGFPSKPIKPTDLPLSTLYDMDYWNKYSRRNGNAATVTWECFLRAAPRKLILVYLRGYADVCKHQNVLLADSKLIISLGFEVVQKVCISAKVGHRLSIFNFNKEILGEFSPEEVTIIFQQWSQNTVGDILDMNEAHFPIALSRSLPLTPSKWIKKDTDEYISRYLGKRYISVLLRMEWVSMYKRESAYNQSLLNCLNKTQTYVKLAKNVAGTSVTFLGMDVGKYGSITISAPNSDIAKDAIEKHLFHFIYPDAEATISKWEETFAQVSQHTTPGYIALLQKSIAVRSTCLLLMGSGSFHKQALDEYLSLHSKHDHCYFETNSHCEKFRSARL